METRNNQLERVWYVSLLALLGVFTILSSFKKQRWDTDIFWALRTGEWILANMSVPQTDPFSYTFAGREWIDFTWGFQVIAYLFYTYLGGWWGLFVLQCLVLLATFVVLFFLVRTIAGDRYWLIVGLIYITFTIMENRFFIRPHLFGYLFMVSYFYIFTLSEKNPPGRYLLLLPLLQILWTNIHSSFVLGIFIAGVWAIGSWLDGCREERSLTAPPPQTWLYGGLTLLLIGVSFINPYGWKLVVFPFIHQMGENAEALRYIQEWQSVPINKFLFEFYPVPPGWLFLKILLALSVIAIFKSGSMRTRDAIFLAVATYMAMKHVRWAAIFPLFTVALVASNITEYTKMKISRGNLFKVIMVAIIPLSVGLLAYNLYIKRDYGLGIKKGRFPEGTVRFIRAMHLSGNLYNKYIFGGYLIYNDIKVFIDGRTPTLYSPLFFWKTRVAEMRRRWDRLAEEYSINMALLKRGDGLCEDLVAREDWVPVIFDDVAVLFLKEDVFPQITDQWALRETPPCYKPGRYKLPEDPEKLKTIEEELERMKTFYSDHGMSERFATLYRLSGLVYMRMEGRLEDAKEELTRALEIRGEDPYIEYDLGLVALELGRLDEAEEHFLNAREFPKALVGLGRAYHRMKRHEDALEVLAGYMEEKGDHTEPDAYRLAGISCFELKDTGCAMYYLERAEFVLTEPDRLAEVYYYLGSIYLELGQEGKAAHYYSNAIKTKPDYRNGLLELVEIFKRKNMPERARRLEKILNSIH